MRFSFITALRQLRHDYRSLTFVIGFLALGISLTCSMFSVIKTVLLEPLPFPDSDKILWLSEAPSAMPEQASTSKRPRGVSYPNFFDWRTNIKSLSALATYRTQDFNLVTNDASTHLTGVIIASDFLKVLGVVPSIGRDFNEKDEQEGTPIAIISNELWTSMYGSSRDVVGEQIRLDDGLYTIIGVMPKGTGWGGPDLTDTDVA